MVDEAARAADRLRGAGERDVAEEMMELTLRAVSRTLFSHDVGDQAATFGRAMTALQDRLAAPGLVPGWLPTPQRARLRRAMAELDAILYALIASRRRAGPDAPRDLLQTLVTAVDEEGDGERLTEREVRDELITLFLAGHETTANALAWTFYLLSQHPEVEARLHAELDAVLGPPSSGPPPRAPSYDDLPRLPYVEQVIKESLRLYPPAFMVVRRAHQDTEIGGFPVPAGSEIVVWTYLTHRDPRWFPEPDRFRPERFAPDEEAKIPKLAYAPFGAGPRACIGKGFAMVEARLLLATLAHRLRFELPPGHHVEPEPRVTLRPKGGLRMTIRPR
jgi:cytochrome P450